MSTPTPPEPPAAAPAAVPVPPRRIVTERRQRPFRAGLGLAVAALLAIVAGAILASASQALSVVGGERALVGNPVTFDADSGRYVVVLVDDPAIDDTTLEGLVVDVECTVERADGQRITVDESTRHDVNLSGSAGTVVTDFEAVSGRTSVTCRWKEGHDNGVLLYAVGRSHNTAQLVGIGLIVLGVLMAVVAATLIVVGVRGRQVIQR